jgi:Tol biopolymer transport system component
MVVSRDAGNLREAVADGGNQAGPSWSPDGTSLAFGRIPALEESPDAVLIRTVALTTSQTSTLPDSKGFFSPRWSPNGKSILAVSAASKELAIFDLERKQWLELVECPLNNFTD